jgi:L-lysine exporter family protein LysE/ArgO
MPIAAFTTGFAVCSTLIVAIGAQNAFVLRQGLRREHVLVIVAFCAFADLILISAGVAGVSSVLGQAPRLTLFLTATGTAFLTWYGIRAFARARTAGTMEISEGTRRTSLGSAVAQVAGFTFLNPHVYLDTVLLIGSIGSRQPSSDARLWFVGGAAAASGAWFSTLGFGARLLRPIFRTARAWQVLDTIIGVTMLVLAGSLLWTVF